MLVFDATFLAGIQKVNDLDIQERHALEVQRDGQLLAIDLHLQFNEMLRLQRPLRQIIVLCLLTAFLILNVITVVYEVEQGGYQ
jgi:hypothetical protein